MILSASDQLLQLAQGFKGKMAGLHCMGSIPFLVPHAVLKQHCLVLDCPSSSQRSWEQLLSRPKQVNDMLGCLTAITQLHVWHSHTRTC